MNIYFSVSRLAQMSALEVHKLYKLRVDVFVAEQKCPYQEIDDIDAAPNTFHVLAFDSAQNLVGTARLFPDTWEHLDEKCRGSLTSKGAGPLWHFGRLCTRKDHRGTGLGADIITQTLRLAQEQAPGNAVALTAQTPLTGYYAQFGFEPIGTEFDWDGMGHVPMFLPFDRM